MARKRNDTQENWPAAILDGNAALECHDTAPTES
jgi:hypothetical protein